MTTELDPPIVERRFRAGTVSLNVAELEHPGKPQLVLLHGGSACWQLWRKEMLELGKHYHVLVPELRGHGRSDNVPGSYSLGGFADDIQSLLEAIEQPALLFGHSLGGAVALLMTARVPSRVSALMLGDSPFTPDSLRQAFSQQERTLRLWADLAGKSPEQIRPQLEAMPVFTADGGSRSSLEVLGRDSSWFGEMAHSLAHHDPTFLTSRLEACEEAYAELADVPALLSRVSCPTLLLQGDARCGGLLTDGEVERAMRHLRRPRHVRLSGIGHGLFFEDRQRVLDVVQAFVAEALSS